MNRTELSTKLTDGLSGAWRRPRRLLVMLSLVAVIAAACGSDATTEVAAEVEDTATTTTEVESVTTTTAEPEPDTESESTTAPDPDVAVAGMTAAWSSGDADLAWSFDSPRCQFGLAAPPVKYAAAVAEWSEFVPDGTAVNISVDVFGDVGAASYDVADGSGEIVAVYEEQPWAIVDGSWYRDVC